MNIAQHGVTKIELVNTFVENSGSRTIRVTANSAYAGEQSFEITFYGNTGALDALPKSADFTAYERDVPDAA